LATGGLKTRIQQLKTQTGVKVKRVRHDGAQQYVTDDENAFYEKMGIKLKMTAQFKSQRNGKAERVSRTPIQRVRAALLDAGADEELWAGAAACNGHVRNRSPNSGLDATPLDTFTGRRPNVSGFRV